MSRLGKVGRERDQKQVRIRSVAVEGSIALPTREGGFDPLYVIPVPNKPGVYMSAWVINKEAKKLFKNSRNKAVITLVCDTNVSGHPTVSMKMQEINIINDADAAEDTPLVAEMKKD